LDPLLSEAYLFLVGSIGSLCVTLCFLPVLWKFPVFLDGLRREAVDTGTIVRLTKFSELNRIRILLRFLFVIPFLILGIDGVRHEHPLNESMNITDVLGIIAGFGCVVSSGITLVIFFPRSIEGEIAERDAARSRKISRLGSRMSDTREWAMSAISHDSFVVPDDPVRDGDAYVTESPIPKAAKSLDDFDDPYSYGPPSSTDKTWTYVASDPRPPRVEKLPPLRPNRRGEDVELGVSNPLPNNALADRRSRIPMDHIIHNWRSPIEFGYNASRLTFQRT